MYIFGMTAFIAFIVTEFWSNDSNIDFMLFCGYFLVLRIAFLLLTLKHTKWPLMLFEPIMGPRKHSDSLMVELAHQKTYNEIQKSDTMQSLSAQSTGSIQEMRSILSNGDLFDGFMSHLLDEYCSEALLSVIEFIQFKNRIRIENAHRFDDPYSYQLDLPKTVPDSAIVRGNESDCNYQQIAMDLVEKYVAVEGGFQINISHDVRRRYTWERIEKLDIEELERLFDPCIEQMIALIRNAFRRFLRSDTFALIQTYSPPPMTPRKIDDQCDVAF